MPQLKTGENYLKYKNRNLLFINTKTDEIKQVDFPNDAHIGKIEQIKIDRLEINLIVVSAQTVDLDGNRPLAKPPKR